MCSVVFAGDVLTYRHFRDKNVGELGWGRTREMTAKSSTDAVEVANAFYEHQPEPLRTVLANELAPLLDTFAGKRVQEARLEVALTEKEAEVQREVLERTLRWFRIDVDVDTFMRRMEVEQAFSAIRANEAEQPPPAGPARDADHCPKCGEYLHDEAGHVCPPR